MEHAESELLLDREMPYTRHKCLPQRAIIGPSRKDFVHGRIVNGRCPMSVCRHGQALPLHSGVEHPQNEIKDPVIAQFALGTALGHREVRQDKCLELRCGELDRNRRRCRLWCRSAHQAMASWQEGGGTLENQITPNTTRA